MLFFHAAHAARTTRLAEPERPFCSLPKLYTGSLRDPSGYPFWHLATPTRYCHPCLAAESSLPSIASSLPPLESGANDTIHAVACLQQNTASIKHSLPLPPCTPLTKQTQQNYSSINPEKKGQKKNGRQHCGDIINDSEIIHGRASFHAPSPLSTSSPPPPPRISMLQSIQVPSVERRVSPLGQALGG